jgi:hypothetical protein
VEKCIGGRRITSNVTWTPTFRNQQLTGKGLSHRVQNHNQHHVSHLQAAIRDKMQCDKKSFLEAVDALQKLNLMAVGGYTDNVVDLCGEDNTDVKRQYLGKGHTILMKQPNQTEFEECWSEVIIKNGLSPSLVDDPLFRKALVTTDRMGQSVVCVGKGTALGKRDTTLPHRHTFSRKIIPADKRLDEEGMSRLKSRMKKVGGTLMSDG